MTKKVIFAIPPVQDERGYATTNQNRQTQYFKDATFIYPMIPALCVSMLISEPGIEALWCDAVAEELNDVEFGKLIVQMSPDYIIFEANTMLIERYYEIINGLKENLPGINIILCGEHATAFPDEVRDKSKADLTISGGKWYFKAFKFITGKEWGDKPLPHINREVTRWWLYAYKNGNFKFIPATYMMASQDCWHRPGCTFCSWANYHPEYKVRSVEDYLDEVEELINKGFKEIFDDSGTFPVGDWLHKFCEGMIDRGYQKHISWGCNMRFGALDRDDYLLMAKAGCRFILWGFESANQATLDRVNKKYLIGQVNEALILSHGAGMWNHLTVMFGYPWESEEQERRTYDMARWLLINGWADSAQATILMAYPGTDLYKWADGHNMLKHKDWAKWDMSESVMKQGYPKDIEKFRRGIYRTAYHPKFIWNKLKRIKSIDDFKFYFRIARKVIDRFGNIREIGKVAVD